MVSFSAKCSHYMVTRRRIRLARLLIRFRGDLLVLIFLDLHFKSSKRVSTKPNFEVVTNPIYFGRLLVFHYLYHIVFRYGVKKNCVLPGTDKADENAVPEGFRKENLAVCLDIAVPRYEPKSRSQEYLVLRW